MLRYYIKIALRHLRKGISYSIINITGLSIGIASIVLIILYVQHEFSFDEYHVNKDQIYRVTGYVGFNEKSWRSHISGDPIPEMRSNFTGVKDGVRMTRCSGGDVEVDGQLYSDFKFNCTESNLFNIFSFSLLARSKKKVLDAPFTTVISKSTAELIFGKKDPVGQTITLNWDRANKEFEVTGVMEDIPDNTHFKYDILISYSSLESTNRCADCGMYMYALLDQKADTALLNDQILHHIREIDGKSFVEDIRLEPLDKIHFSSLYAPRKGDWQYIQLLTAIALVILFIACGNYMNLAMARYAKRSREIGIRKVLGAYRWQLARQFLFETIILTLIALPFALALVTLCIPWFNSYAGTEVSLAIGINFWFYPAIAGVLLFTGLMAGSYPAFFVASFRPQEVLQGNQRMGLGAAGLRKGLVAFQFLAGMVMIAVTVLIARQLDYVLQKNLGFDSDKLIQIQVKDPGLSNQGNAIRQELLNLASVEAVTMSPAPAAGRFGNINLVFRSDSIADKKYTFTTPYIDEHFIETMGIKLLAGRNIIPQKPNDTTRIKEALVNEKAVKTLGIADNKQIVGRVVAKRFRIAGVVEDFHLESLQHEIEPALLRFNPFGHISVVNVRLSGGNIRKGLEDLRTVWKDKLGSDRPLEYAFVNDLIQQQYEQEQNTAKVIGIFSGLSILIAGMGLFGLAAYTTQQRYREIGIRKVLGAGIGNILLLLYKDFGKLIVLATLFATPVIYYAGKRWLENFAYSVQITPLIFVIGILGVIVITLVATSVSSVKAALMNPVDTIRQE